VNYLGGKHFIAKRLAAAMRAEVGDAVCWEPFCGGLNMTCELGKVSAGIATDHHPALISLYASMRAGWDPPSTSITDVDYENARALPDSDPRKAFIGFGCSFGGKWFGGRARPRISHAENPAIIREPVSYARSGLLRKVHATRHWTIARVSFFELPPRKAPFFIYADPPYAGATGYGASFDHAAFWERCRGWARAGVTVYASEFACPVRHRLVLTIAREHGPSGKHRTAFTEQLYRVLP
jgi:DNA adenine methylase